MKTQRITLIMIAFALATAGCLPSNLDKYRKNKGSSASTSLFGPGADIASPGPDTSKVTTEPAQPRKARTSIYAVDSQTFRFNMNEKQVWNAAINVLMRNYNLTIVNQASGILTTEWDSFYLNDEVLRNKISLRINRSSYGVVDVTIHNNVEKLRDASQAAGTVGAVWLPAKDEANEVARVIQNMALVLNQPPPVLPPGMEVATGEGIEIRR